MILFIAGNFPQMADPELEEECHDFVVDQLGEYNRLVSFFYKKGTETVMMVKEKIENN
uniref:Uncharacterized protein n=1 Tax=viral metagenome TaxID=1070528 RepID=A0A6M3KNK9_9ZZZZ